MPEGEDLLADDVFSGHVGPDVEERGRARVDLHDREIVVRALVHAHAAHVLPVREEHAVRAEARRDVFVREDESVGPDEEAGADALRVLDEDDLRGAHVDRGAGEIFRRGALS